VTTESKAPSVADLVDPAYFNRGYSVYEPGLYLSPDRSLAENYNDGAVLDIRLNVKNPKIYSQEFAYKSSLENYRLTNGLQLSGQELINQYAEYLKSQGYNAIQIGNPLVPSRKIIVFFEPKQVVVVRP
jgi:hypothetical protein